MGSSHRELRIVGDEEDAQSAATTSYRGQTRGFIWRLELVDFEEATRTARTLWESAYRAAGKAWVKPCAPVMDALGFSSGRLRSAGGG
jgi:hypothetical protein